MVEAGSAGWFRWLCSFFRHDGCCKGLQWKLARLALRRQPCPLLHSFASDSAEKSLAEKIKQEQWWK